MDNPFGDEFTFNQGGVHHDGEKLSFNFNLLNDVDDTHNGLATTLPQQTTTVVDESDLLDESNTLNSRSKYDDTNIETSNRSVESQLFSMKLENHCLQQQVLELTKLLEQVNKKNNTTNNNVGVDNNNNNVDDVDNDDDDDDEEKAFEELMDKLMNPPPPATNEIVTPTPKEKVYQPKIVLTEEEKNEIDLILQQTINSMDKISQYSNDALKQSTLYVKYKTYIRGRRTAIEVKEKKRVELLKEIKSTGIRALRQSKSRFFKDYNAKIASYFDYNLPKISNSSQLELKDHSNIKQIQDNEEKVLEVEEEEEKKDLPTIEEVENEDIIKMNGNGDEEIPNIKDSNSSELKFQCHICRKKYGQLHFFYEQLCWDCANFNYSYRFITADMKDRIVLVTGSRVKIGYQCCLKLLRAGATVIATSRFSKDTVIRYSMEKDFDQWKDRLHVYSLDLRDLRATEAFCKYLSSTFPYLSCIINNAAQTISRPPIFYKIPIELELQPIEQLPIDLQKILNGNNQKEQYFIQSGINTNYYHFDVNSNDITCNIGFGRNQLQLTNLEDINNISNQQIVDGANHDNKNNNNYKMIDDINSKIVFEEMDADAQPEDKRSVNSWIQQLNQVPVIDMLEAHAVSAFSPFILNSLLMPMLKKGVKKLGSTHIINVSAMEGKFTRYYKSSNHPHTNMAKASMNMMTRTAALGYATHGIYLNSVDTGWITNENPYEVRVRPMQNGIDFQPPLDEIDGASRVLAPIFDGINNSNNSNNSKGRYQKTEHDFGLFFKDYKPTSW